MDSLNPYRFPKGEGPNESEVDDNVTFETVGGVSTHTSVVFKRSDNASSSSNGNSNRSRTPQTCSWRILIVLAAVIVIAISVSVALVTSGVVGGDDLSTSSRTSCPCVNNGTCVANVNGTTVCQCPNNCAGIHCELCDACFAQPCANNGVCYSTPDGDYACLCARGHTGTDCSLADPCLSNPCIAPGSLCTPQAHPLQTNVSIPVCVCPLPGFLGPFCQGGTLSGRLVDRESGTGVSDAMVSFMANSSLSVSSNDTGYFSMPMGVVPLNSSTFFFVYHDHYEIATFHTNQSTIAIQPGTETLVTIQLSRHVATLISTSPFDGESGVKQSRPVVFTFDRPVQLMNESQLVSVIAAGANVTFSIEFIINSTRVKLFPLSPFPIAALVSLTLQPNSLVDAETLIPVTIGARLRTIRFETVQQSLVPGTAVCGRIFGGNYLASVANVSLNVPIANVNVHLFGIHDRDTYTDSSGYFIINNATAGYTGIQFDGSTANGLAPGDYFPTVSKSLFLAPGVLTKLENIFLPTVVNGTLQPVSTQTGDVSTVGAAPSVVGAWQSANRATLVINADALMDAIGQSLAPGVSLNIGIAFLIPQRLPGPTPSALLNSTSPPVTIQSSFPVTFSNPMPICFPTSSSVDPSSTPLTTESSTGNMEAQPLPAFAESALNSFNHDSNDWESIARMIVSADGLQVCTVPGEGVIAPGWHISAPVTGGIGSPPLLDDPTPPACGRSFVEWMTDVEELLLCLANFFGLGRVFRCGNAIGHAMIDGLIALLANWYPVPQTLGGRIKSSWKTFVALRDAKEKFLDGCGKKKVKVGTAVKQCVTFAWSKLKQLYNHCQNDPECNPTLCSLVNGLRDKVTDVLRKIDVSSEEFGKVRQIFDAGKDVIDNRRSLPGLLLHIGDVVEASTVDPITGDTIFHHDLEEVELAGNLLNQHAHSLRAGLELQLGEIEGLDGFEVHLKHLSQSLHAAVELTFDVPSISDQSAPSALPSFPVLFAEYDYAIETHLEVNDAASSVAVIRGKSSSRGMIANILLQPNVPVTLHVYDRVSNTYGRALTFTSRAGVSTRFSRPVMVSTTTLNDTDEDSLADAVEYVLGTNALNRDTDGDGVDDGIEISLNADPLSLTSLRTGVIATAAVPGMNNIVEVCTTDEYLIATTAATGSAGSSTGNSLIFSVVNNMLPAVFGLVPVAPQNVVRQTVCAADADGVPYFIRATSTGLTIVDVRAAAEASSLTSSGNNGETGIKRLLVTPLGTDVVTTVPGNSGLVFAKVKRSHRIFAVDIVTGGIIGDYTMTGQVPGADMVDMVMLEGSLDVFIARTASSIHVLRLRRNVGAFEWLSSESSGPVPSGSLHPLFATQTSALSVDSNGFSRFSVDMTIGRAPSQFIDRVSSSALQIFPFRQILAVDEFIAMVATSGADVQVFSLSSPPTPQESFVRNFPLPGAASSEAFLRALLYLGGPSGISVINPFEPDFGQQVPTILRFWCSSCEGNVPEKGRTVMLAVVARDDIAVSRVEFFRISQSAENANNRTLLTNDATFPFTSTDVLPLSDFALFAAIAYDAAGLSSTLVMLNISTRDDQTPPFVVRHHPSSHSYYALQDSRAVAVFFSEHVDIDTAKGLNFTISRELHTRTLEVVPSSVFIDNTTFAAIAHLPSDLNFGTYCVSVRGRVVDRVGLTADISRNWCFSMLFPSYTNDLLCASSPCLHGGYCWRTRDSYACECLFGFSGSACETREDVCASGLVSCANGGTCVSLASMGRCQCSSSWHGPSCTLSTLDLVGGAITPTSDRVLFFAQFVDLSQEKETIVPVPIESARAIMMNGWSVVIRMKLDSFICSEFPRAHCPLLHLTGHNDSALTVSVVSHTSSLALTTSANVSVVVKGILSQSVSSDTWTHILLTCAYGDNDAFSTYLDGILFSHHDTSDLNRLHNVSTLILGRPQSLHGRGYMTVPRATVGSLELFDRPLTAGEAARSFGRLLHLTFDAPPKRWMAEPTLVFEPSAQSRSIIESGLHALDSSRHKSSYLLGAIPVGTGVLSGVGVPAVEFDQSIDIQPSRSSAITVTGFLGLPRESHQSVVSQKPFFEVSKSINEGSFLTAYATSNRGIRLTLRDQLQSETLQLVTAAGILESFQYHHFAISWTRQGVLSLTMNGQLIGTARMKTLTLLSDAAFQMQHIALNSWLIAIDDIQIFDRALSPGEIRRLMHRGDWVGVAPGGSQDSDDLSAREAPVWPPVLVPATSKAVRTAVASPLEPVSVALDGVSAALTAVSKREREPIPPVWSVASAWPSIAGNVSAGVQTVPVSAEQVLFQAALQYVNVPRYSGGVSFSVTNSRPNKIAFVTRLSPYVRSQPGVGLNATQETVSVYVRSGLFDEDTSCGWDDQRWVLWASKNVTVSSVAAMRDIELAPIHVAYTQSVSFMVVGRFVASVACGRRCETTLGDVIVTHWSDCNSAGQCSFSKGQMLGEVNLALVDDTLPLALIDAVPACERLAAIPGFDYNTTAGIPVDAPWTVSMIAQLHGNTSGYILSVGAAAAVAGRSYIDGEQIDEFSTTIVDLQRRSQTSSSSTTAHPLDAFGIVVLASRDLLFYAKESPGFPFVIPNFWTPCVAPAWCTVAFALRLKYPGFDAFRDGVKIGSASSDLFGTRPATRTAIEPPWRFGMSPDKRTFLNVSFASLTVESLLDLDPSVSNLAGGPGRRAAQLTLFSLTGTTMIDRTLVDDSGHSRHAVIPARVTIARERISFAAPYQHYGALLARTLTFYGDNEPIKLGENGPVALLNNSCVSVSLVFRVNSSAGGIMGDAGCEPSLYTLDSPASSASIVLDPVSLALTVRVVHIADASTASRVCDVRVPDRLLPDQWTRLTAVLNGTSSAISLFVNGVMEGTGACHGPSLFATNPNATESFLFNQTLGGTWYEVGQLRSNVSFTGNTDNSSATGASCGFRGSFSSVSLSMGNETDVQDMPYVPSSGPANLTLITQTPTSAPLSRYSLTLPEPLERGNFVVLVHGTADGVVQSVTACCPRSVSLCTRYTVDVLARQTGTLLVRVETILSPNTTPLSSRIVCPDTVDYGVHEMIPSIAVSLVSQTLCYSNKTSCDHHAYAEASALSLRPGHPIDVNVTFPSAMFVPFVPVNVTQGIQEAMVPLRNMTGGIVVPDGVLMTMERLSSLSFRLSLNATALTGTVWSLCIASNVLVDGAGNGNLGVCRRFIQIPVSPCSLVPVVTSAHGHVLRVSGTQSPVLAVNVSSGVLLLASTINSVSVLLSPIPGNYSLDVLTRSGARCSHTFPVHRVTTMPTVRLVGIGVQLPVSATNSSQTLVATFDVPRDSDLGNAPMVHLTCATDVHIEGVNVTLVRHALLAKVTTVFPLPFGCLAANASCLLQTPHAFVSMRGVGGAASQPHEWQFDVTANNASSVLTPTANVSSGLTPTANVSSGLTPTANVSSLVLSTPALPVAMVAHNPFASSVFVAFPYVALGELPSLRSVRLAMRLTRYTPVSAPSLVSVCMWRSTLCWSASLTDGVAMLSLPIATLSTQPALRFDVLLADTSAQARLSAELRFTLATSLPEFHDAAVPLDHA